MKVIYCVLNSLNTTKRREAKTRTQKGQMGAVKFEKLSRHTTQNSNQKQNESNYQTQNKWENKA